VNKGCFITLEGGEGVGKSSSVQCVADCLRSWGREVIVTREPGGTPLGEGLREMLLRTEHLSDEAELLMMFAARMQHSRDVILPALAAGRWVVSDRFTDSSYAYQGGGRGLPMDMIELLEGMLPRSLKPDLTLLLDAPVEVGLARAQARGGMDRFELQHVDFQQRVRQTYLERARRFPERFVIIEAAASMQHVHKNLLTALESRCASWL
jgi:dTMP kinase